MQAAERDGDGAREEVLPVVSQQRRVRQRSCRRRHLEAEPLSLDRIGERRIGIVAHVRRRSRCVIDRIIGGQLGDALVDRLAKAVKDDVLDLRTVADACRVGAELDASRGRERIRRGDARLIQEHALEDEVLREDPVPLLGPAVIGVLIGNVLDRGAPVPAIPEVRILELAADVLDGTIGLHGEPDLPVAELVAEQERHAAGHARAERPTGRHAECRLADRVEGKRRVIRGDREIRARHQARHGILQVVRDGCAAGRVARREDACGRHGRARGHRLPARAGSVERVHGVALILEHREQHPAGGRGNRQCR